VGGDHDEPPVGATTAQGLLVVCHSRGGSTRHLAEAAAEAARQAAGIPVRVLAAEAAAPPDVMAAGGILLATPARFGFMAGLLKDFLERIYHPCLDRTVGLPYALIVKGDTDVDGAVASVERIVTGLRWRAVLPPLKVVGPVRPSDLEAAAELGATLAAGLEGGIF